MSRLAIELLFATAAAFWIGSKQSTWRALLSWSIGLALITWLVRIALIVAFPTDLAVSEDYLNGLTVRNASTELAVFCLWSIAWSGIGMAFARRRQSVTGVR